MRKFLFFFVNWLFTVGDEYVELCDLFLRFVFYVLLISFRCAWGRNFFESNENIDKVAWIEGLMLSFYGWKVRVDGRDLILFCVVVFP